MASRACSCAVAPVHASVGDHAFFFCRVNRLVRERKEMVAQVERMRSESTDRLKEFVSFVFFLLLLGFILCLYMACACTLPFAMVFLVGGSPFGGLCH